MNRTAITLLVGLSAAFATTFTFGSAHAQAEGFGLNRFEPSERGSDWFVSDSLDLRGKMRPAFGVVGDFAYRPQSFHDADTTVPLVKHQLTAHIGGSMIVADRFRFAFNLPVIVDQAGNDLVADGVAYKAPASSSAASDLRLSADVRLFGEYGGVATGAFGVRVFAPIGKAEDYAGDGKVRFEPHFSLAGMPQNFAYAVSVGFLYRASRDSSFANTAIGSEIPFRLGVGAALADRKLVIGPELYGSVIAAGSGDQKVPMGLLVGAHYSVADFRLGFGAGPGLSHAAGTAQLRILASVEWAPGVVEAPPPVLDRDGDGVTDDKDACLDVKGVATSDPKTNGCPPDKDGDGVPDGADACPDKAGVRTSDPKTNGCPPVEPDKDADGVPDLVDACPDVAGAKSDDPKKNGCPPDKDGDGIPDMFDTCLNTPGVKSDDPAKNGCPPDRDGDGIPDSEDACPDQPGKNDTDPKKNGCPLVKIEDGQVKISEQIKFKTASAEILAESQPIVDEVAKVLKAHPEIKKLRIEGHTDNVGAKVANKTLSTKRAASVLAALVAVGVEKSRLKSVGLGQDKPIDTNTTEEGRANNRRVEFHIEGDAKDVAKPKPGAPKPPTAAKPPAPVKPPAPKK